MKRLVYIFIPVLAVLLMSHNSFAETANYNLSTQNLTWQGNQYGSSSFVNGSLSYNSSYGLNLGKNEINYLQWSLPASVNLDNFNNYTFTFRLITGMNFTPASNDIYPLTDYSITENECSLFADGFTFGNDSGVFINNNYQKCFTVTVKGYIRHSLASSNIFVLGRWSNNNKLIQYFNNYLDPTSSFFPNTFLLNPQLTLLESDSEDIANAVNGQQEAAGETQSQAGDSASSSSEQAVEGATQSLFSAMGSVVSALRDTPASDCLITVSSVGSSQVFTSAIGQLNVCSVPSGILAIVQGLAALVIVPMVLMACYSLLHKIYNAFKEVQDT